MSGPLKGIRVLDLSRLLPGPVCTHLLRRMGATVMKVEGKGSGQADYVRDIPPTIRVGPDRKHGSLFEALHAGKLGFALDLKSEQGVAVLKRIVKDVDVIAEGNRPGVMDRLGVGYTSLSQINPRLIYCSLTGYGQTGPFAMKAGHDINYMAVSGLLGLTGNKNDAPPTIGFQAADCAGALQAVIGILGAVVERGSTGQGQMVDISLTESVMSLAMPSLVGALVGYVPQRGEGMLDGALPNYRSYRTKDDQYLSVGALEGQFWSKLCNVMGRPEFDKVPDRAEVEAWFASKTLDEWMAVFSQADVCVEPISSGADVMKHPQHVARNVILSDSDESGSDSTDNKQKAPQFPRKQIVLGPRLSNHTATMLPPAPRIGEHTTVILESYGLSKDEIKLLHQCGAVYCLDLDDTSRSARSSNSAQKTPASPATTEPLKIPPESTQLAPYRVEVEAGKEYWWCACGKSKNQPFCDGSHKTHNTGIVPVKVVPEETRLYGFCGCRASLKGPRCDGTHKKLKTLQQGGDILSQKTNVTSKQ